MELEDEKNDTVDCTICLEPVSDPAVAQPCGHFNFDFICVTTWLQNNTSCPLCKFKIQNVKHNFHRGKFDIYEIKPIEDQRWSASSRRHISRPFTRPGYQRRYPRFRASVPLTLDESIERRRQVYRHKTYSRHVGSNRISGYREITHVDFQRSEQLVSRAKKWIRRELRVFNFLHDANTTSSEEASSATTNRTGGNAEFLLSYIIAILKTVDIKGADGQAEDLLTDYLGREDSSLFLHELRAFLRSPYETLEAFDNHVQYDPVNSSEQSNGLARQSRAGKALNREQEAPRRRYDSYRPTTMSSGLSSRDKRNGSRSFRVTKPRDRR